MLFPFNDKGVPVHRIITVIMYDKLTGNNSVKYT